MSAQLPQTPIPTPPSPLIALPEEIRAAIASHLNHADALSLRYTHSCFEKATELPLWRELDLSITQRWGELPSTYEHPIGSRDYEAWLEGEVEQASAAYEARLQRKTTAMLKKGDDRRFGMTRRARFVNREGAVLGVLAVLECVSSNLQRLDIEDSLDHISEERSAHNYYRHIEYIMLGAGLSFPSLTHVYLGGGSVRYSGSIFLLCQLAPNLAFLSIQDVRAHDDHLMPPELRHSFPKEMVDATRIRCLRVSSSAPIAVFAEIAGYSPHLTQLSLVMRGAGADDMEILSGSLLQSNNLLELHSDFPISDFSVMHLHNTGGYLTSLHTAVLKYWHWHDPWQGLPPFARLRTVYLDRPQPQATCAAFTEELHQAPLAQGMVPIFTRALHRTKLRTIRTIDLRKFASEDDSTVFSVLDEPEYAAEIICVFRMIHNKGNDAPVQHARMLLDKWEIDDVPRAQCTARNLGEDSHFPYETKDGVKRVKIFETLPRPIWQDFTDYEGAVVPLEIISRMYEVEGNGAADSDEQRVEVGDGAWKVLTDWVEARQMAQAS